MTILAAALAWAGPALARRAPTPYTVAKVSVVADAKDAVVAKKNALAKAQQDALRILMKRMTHWRAHGRLPVLRNAMVDRMINGFSVRRESNSTTRYMATLDFDFEPHAVRDLLNRFGLPYVDQQAPQVLLLPVMLEAGGLKRGTSNPWYAALAAVDGEHALTPVKLAPPRSDFSPSMIENLAKHSRELFETLKYQYRAENLVLAAAEVDAQATQLQVRLVGHDAVGSFTLSRTYRVYDRDIHEAAAIAAEVSVKIIEGRWKTTRLSRGAPAQCSGNASRTTRPGFASSIPKGPVPTGSSLPGPSSRRGLWIAKKGWERVARSAALARSRLISTTWGPMRSARPANARSRTRCSKLPTTASASNGVPSWKATPSRRVKVQVR